MTSFPVIGGAGGGAFLHLEHSGSCEGSTGKKDLREKVSSILRRRRRPVKRRCVNLAFGSRKPRKSSGPPAERGAQRASVFWKRQPGGCVQSFCHSEQIHPGLLPLAADAANAPHRVSLHQRFASRCAARLFFFALLISSDSHEHHFPWSGRGECESVSDLR